jgi:hypothetical protein
VLARRWDGRGFDIQKCPPGARELSRVLDEGIADIRLT